MQKHLKATHYGKIKIQDLEISCAILEDGRRVLVERSMALSLGVRGGGRYWEKRKENGALLPEYISAKYLLPFISDKLRKKLTNSISYINSKGKLINGIEATILPEICDIWIKAKENGALDKKRIYIAERAYILMKGFANIGIIALVDEATGYQEIRDKNALQAILDAYLSKELAAWAKCFPDEFYKEMFRLRNWEWKGMSINRPQVVGRYTSNIVYDRLVTNIREELEKRNPKMEDSKRKHRHHQWFTVDVGHPALSQHLHAVIGLMRASSNWDAFMRLLNRAFPKKGQQLELDID